MKLFYSLLIISLIAVLCTNATTCAFGSAEVRVVVVPDENPGELLWRVFVIPGFATLASSVDAGLNNTFCLNNGVYRWQINDSGGDGIGPDGFFNVFVNEVLVIPFPSTFTNVFGTILEIDEPSVPTASPSAAPSSAPTITTLSPTTSPTLLPSSSPTSSPFNSPTAVPSLSPSFNPTITSMGRPCNPGQELFEFTLTPDSVPEDLYFNLRNIGTGEYIFNEGSITGPIQREACLNDGVYRFQLFDASGNGICCSNGAGSFMITLESNQLLSGAEFGSLAESVFSVGDSVTLPPSTAPSTAPTVSPTVAPTTLMCNPGEALVSFVIDANDFLVDVDWQLLRLGPTSIIIDNVDGTSQSMCLPDANYLFNVGYTPLTNLCCEFGGFIGVFDDGVLVFGDSLQGSSDSFLFAVSSGSIIQSVSPTLSPTSAPSSLYEPSRSPTIHQTISPTMAPSSSPSLAPNSSPSLAPSLSPSPHVCMDPETYPVTVEIIPDNSGDSILYIIVEDTAGQDLVGSSDETGMFCLPAGFYVFQIFDEGNDGLCCTNGMGSYTIYVDGEAIHTGGEFGSSEVVEFDVYGGLTTAAPTVICTSPYVQVDIALTFDDKPEETSYDLFKSLVATPIIESRTSSSSVCLDDGLYYLTIYDSGNDGLCCGSGEGGYSVFVDGVQVISGSGIFNDSILESFTVNTMASPPSSSPTLAPSSSPSLLPSVIPTTTTHSPTLSPSLAPSTLRPSECNETEALFSLHIEYDSNPDEISWTLEYQNEMNNLEVVVRSIEGENVGDVYRCLPPGSYVFQIVDSGEDGLCCGEGMGYYIVNLETFGMDGGITQIGTGSDFGESAVHFFRVSSITEAPTALPTCANGELIIFVDIVEDEREEETSWNVYRAGNNMEIYSGEGGSGALLCLSAGLYLFEILDTGEDGICCDFGMGSYQISWESTILLNGDGDFGASDINLFRVPSITSPTAAPSLAPSLVPTPSFSQTPSFSPAPTSAPQPPSSAPPTQSSAPSLTPPPTPFSSSSPTIDPDNPNSPSFAPSISPTRMPTMEGVPAPSASPSQSPSAEPSTSPSRIPSIHPTAAPGALPSVSPSVSPTPFPSVSPSIHPTTSPSSQPTPDNSFQCDECLLECQSFFSSGPTTCDGLQGCGCAPPAAEFTEECQGSLESLPGFDWVGEDENFLVSEYAAEAVNVTNAMRDLLLNNYYDCLQQAGPASKCLIYYDRAVDACLSLEFDPCNIVIAFDGLDSPSFYWPYCLPDTCSSNIAEIYGGYGDVEVIETCQITVVDDNNTGAGFSLRSTNILFLAQILSIIVIFALNF